MSLLARGKISAPRGGGNRSTRGQGTKSRGASNSSSSSSRSNSPNPYERERLENEKNRARRAHPASRSNGDGRGASRGTRRNKSVRFADQVEEHCENEPTNFAKMNTSPFESRPAASPSIFGVPAATNGAVKFNPFAPGPRADAPAGVFGIPIAMSNPFGNPSQTFKPASNSTTGVYEKQSGPAVTSLWQSAPAHGSGGSSALTIPGTSTQSPFGAPQQINGTRGPSSASSSPFNFKGPSPAASSGSPPFSSALPKAGSQIKLNTALSSSESAPHQQAPISQSKSVAFSMPSSTLASLSDAPKTALAQKIEDQIKRDRLVAPRWPDYTPWKETSFNDPILTPFKNSFQEYRGKVRSSLMKAGLLDDPDKPKKLSEAIEFKGICEEMCPDFERIERISDKRLERYEKEVAPDGKVSPNPSLRRMVKAMARSAAGQDAPLPQDIRSVAALRRTVDYLLDTLLAENEHDLPSIHNYLRDRTRAIRRDFVFHSNISSSELVDQVYCLERITRFHVTSLHLLSKGGLAGAESFSEQQELEQLGKSLLSLVHSYEDGRAQGIPCENEAEFRAYYVIFNSQNPGILDTVQNWGWKFYGESEEIQTAISIAETIQNTWDSHGPLKPMSPTNVAQNAFSRFFTIVENKRVSYTMACFAEIYFNPVRRAILKTILSAYRKQRDQTKDWTLSKLNTYLRFEDEEDIIPFGEAHGLQFGENDGQGYLSFDLGSFTEGGPRQKQPHSSIVERKRGDHSIVEAMRMTLFDESVQTEQVAVEDDALFVTDNSKPSKSVPKPFSFMEDDIEVPSTTLGSGPPTPASPGFFASIPEDSLKPASVFNRVEASKQFGSERFTHKSTVASSPAQPSVLEPPSISTKPAATEAQSLFKKPPVSELPPTSVQPLPSEEVGSNAKSTTFDFLNKPHAPPSGHSSSSPSGINSKITPLPDPRPSFFPTQQPAAATSVQQSSTQPVLFKQPEALTNSQSLLPTFGTHAPTAPQNNTLSDPPQTPSLAPEDLPSKVDSGSAHELPNLFSAASTPPQADRTSLISDLSNWVFLGRGGLADQFTDNCVEEILLDAFESYNYEEERRVLEAAAAILRAEADNFRFSRLATRYFHRWRDVAHELRLKRRGREARQARREMAESFRAAKAAQSSNVVEEFRATQAAQSAKASMPPPHSTNRRRRDSLESLLDSTGVLNGVHDANEEARMIVHKNRSEHPHKRQRSDRSTGSPISNTSKHRRGRSGNPLRRSIMSDPSYLDGGSRLHLLSNYDAQNQSRHQVSGVQTDYFRLKARGITTLPDGTALASSAAKSMLQHKRSFDGFQVPSTPQQTRRHSVARSTPTPSASRYIVGTDPEIQELKARARALMDEDKQRDLKRTLVEDDDDELFLRARRVRAQMDEGSEWLRREIERDSGSLSAS